MAKAMYLLQGLVADENHQNKIAEILKKYHDEIIIYSAFLREGSVYDVKDELEVNCGKVTAVIGIRNGITSSQGLKALIKLGVKTYAVDTGSSLHIFHPKTLVAVNKMVQTADVMIGSANFTPGGFIANMENSAFLQFDLTNPDDKSFIDAFYDGFTQITNSFSLDNVIVIDSEKVIDDLLKEGRIIDEATNPIISTVGKNSTGTQSVARMSLKIGKHKAATKRKSKGTSCISPSMTRPAVVATDSITGNIKEVWKSKELVERDLCTPSNRRTHATGSMLMKKGAYDIDFRDYFRNTVFGGLAWAKKQGKQNDFEFATAKFHFIIDGIDNGAYNLTLKFDSRTNTRTYKQNQPNVHLMWGDATAIIKNRNLLGQIMHLYSIDGKTDEFVIEIKDN